MAMQFTGYGIATNLSNAKTLQFSISQLVYPCLFYVYANPNRAPGLILPTESDSDALECTGEREREVEGGGEGR